jgi:hypothetical protein
VALIVEDGSVVSGADSYVSIADCTTYHAAQGNPAWAAAAEADQETALRRATKWLDNYYRGRWTGVKSDEDQALAWPRSQAVDEDGCSIDDDEIPQVVKDAACEAALRALSATLDPDISRIKSRVKVGPIEVDYDLGSPPWTEFAIIARLLSGLTTSRTAVKLERA